MKDLIMTIITVLLLIAFVDGASLYLLNSGHFTIYGAGFLIIMVQLVTVFGCYGINSQYRQYLWKKQYELNHPPRK